MASISLTRTTKETEIGLTFNLYGSGQAQIDTGIGFFDHMLTALAVHGGLDLTLKCQGDLYVDGHHTVEDVGIVFGQALAQAVGDKKGISRYGTFYVPMDEALARAVLDFSGRPYLVFDAVFQPQPLGGFDPFLTEEFFRAVVYQAGLTAHLTLLSGKNDHHKIEALFKAFAHALKMAAEPNGQAVPLSTKGVL